ncbi:MAG: hypothetical protein ACJA1F_002231, partial [Paracoccaceae bacterium]
DSARHSYRLIEKCRPPLVAGSGGLSRGTKWRGQRGIQTLEQEGNTPS